MVPSFQALVVKCSSASLVGLAITMYICTIYIYIYIRCIHCKFGKNITKYTVKNITKYTVMYGLQLYTLLAKPRCS
jgi:hypothetical protein